MNSCLKIKISGSYHGDIDRTLISSQIFYNNHCSMYYPVIMNSGNINTDYKSSCTFNIQTDVSHKCSKVLHQKLVSRCDHI